MEDRLRLESVSIELTALCNQHCSYCYNAWREDGGKEMGQLSHDKLKPVIDELFEQVELDFVLLTGGEPFVRRDIHEVIDQINGRGVPVGIISNGGMISEKVAARLAKQDVRSVQMTLAGADAATHDAVAGRGSFDGVVRAFQRLGAAGVHAAGSYLCTSKNFGHGGAVLELFHALGTNRIAFNRFNPSGYAREISLGLMPSGQQVVHALKLANEVAGRLNLDVTATMPIPPCVTKHSDYPRIKFGFCSIGTKHSQYAIGPNGSVRMCTLQGKAMGSIFESTLPELLERGAVEQFRGELPEFCEPCGYKDACLGGCGASAEWTFGVRAELDPFVAQHVMDDYHTRVAQSQLIQIGG